MRKSKYYREYDAEGNVVRLQCRCCKEIKEAKDYYPCRGKKDGISTICVVCDKKTSKRQQSDKAKSEIQRIYTNVTKQLYPHSGVQYGIVYGVHCTETNRWYIGQTQTSFQHRYDGDFFKNKVNELSEESTHGQLLNSDIEKFGIDKFEVFEVLDIAFSAKELDEKEAYYIDLYNSWSQGYNSNRGNIFKHNKDKRSEQN